MSAQTYHILGVMSGSSLDALDMALVQFSIAGNEIRSWSVVDTRAITLPETWVKRLRVLPESDLQMCYQTDADFGTWIGEQCAALIRDTGIVPHAVVSHGHTVLHHPEEGFTVQIGHPSQIAHEVPCPVITGLRQSDIAAGGQGAPLAPLVERYLFPGFEFYLNLGGIANLTFSNDDSELQAWDVVPCNQLLNFIATELGLPYDESGALARQGIVQRALLETLRSCRQLPLAVPSSLDNSWVQTTYFTLLKNSGASTHDKLTTAVEYIAESIAVQTRACGGLKDTPKMMVSGGGAHNRFLTERIQHHIAPVSLVIPDAQTINFKEAILVSLCGLFRLLEIPNAIPGVTGAAYPTINGQITAAQGGTH